VVPNESEVTVGISTSLIATEVFGSAEDIQLETVSLLPYSLYTYAAQQSCDISIKYVFEIHDLMIEARMDTDVVYTWQVYMQGCLSYNV
jgi:hypothetical protein